MYFHCGGPGAEPPHMQRGPCFPLPDDKMGGVPTGNGIQIQNNLKLILL